MSSTTAAPAVPAVGSGRGPTKLWLPPRTVTGTQVRSLVRLSPGRRAVVIGLAMLTGGGAAAVGTSSDQPGLSPLLLVAGLALTLGLQQTWLRRIRRDHGFVVVTPVQFDLVCALSNLPAPRIDEGRQLYDTLVWHLQQPQPDRAALAAIEQHMRYLLATAWQPVPPAVPS